MKYRILTRWPNSKPNWGYVPEHDGVTLTRARDVVRSSKHWQPCGLQQRITTTGGRIVITHQSRVASRSRQDAIRRAYLPELFG